MTTRQRIYWTAQILGWGLYSAAGMTLAASEIGWRANVITGYGLFWVYSVGLTHGLRWLIHRGHWLSRPPFEAFARIAAGTVVVGTIQTALVILISAALEGKLGTFGAVRFSLGAWFGITVVAALWTTLYVAISSTARYWESRRNETQSQLALREAELRALEAQINPHFLFNCLNTIRGMISENPAHAQDMVTRLANILRHNLRRDDARTVPLSREVEVVSDYLALESARFEDRLRVEFAIDAAAAETPVPAMLLQILVENAIKHGIATLPAGGDLAIRASVAGDLLLIEVENTGELSEPRPGGTHIGLRNARERLRLLYGDRASLQLANREGARVAATVRIPRFA